MIRNRPPEDLQEQDQQPKLNDACQSRMSLIVELEIPKLCERNYGNRKQTSSHNEDDPPSHKFGNGHH
jgi:hypothetical protein